VGTGIPTARKVPRGKIKRLTFALRFLTSLSLEFMADRERWKEGERRRRKGLSE